MPKKCALSHGSGVLGRDPRDSCRFRVHSHTDSAWIPCGGGGGSANLEPGSYM